MHSNLKTLSDAREEIIKMDFGGLNDMQLKAVMATEGPLLVLLAQEAANNSPNTTYRKPNKIWKSV